MLTQKERVSKQNDAKKKQQLFGDFQLPAVTFSMVYHPQKSVKGGPPENECPESWPQY